MERGAGASSATEGRVSYRARREAAASSASSCMAEKGDSEFGRAVGGGTEVVATESLSPTGPGSSGRAPQLESESMKAQATVMRRRDCQRVSARVVPRPGQRRTRCNEKRGGSGDWPTGTALREQQCEIWQVW